MKGAQSREQRVWKAGRELEAGWARESCTAVAKRGQRKSRSAWEKEGGGLAVAGGDVSLGGGWRGRGVAETREMSSARV